MGHVGAGEVGGGGGRVKRQRRTGVSCKDASRLPLRSSTLNVHNNAGYVRFVVSSESKKQFAQMNERSFFLFFYFFVLVFLFNKQIVICFMH
jgi:hypothetical protein